MLKNAKNKSESLEVSALLRVYIKSGRLETVIFACMDVRNQSLLGLLLF